MNPTRDRLLFALKLLLGGALVYYVLNSRMVDFATLRSVLTNPLNLLISVLFLTVSALLCATRWYFLVRAQGLDLSLKKLFELTMIGNFFNTFMPGSVGGDLIKAWYVAGQEPKRRTKAITTVLIDRVIGLAVIVFYAAFTLLFFTEWLKGQRELQGVAMSLWGFSALSIVVAIIFFTPGLWNLKITHRALEFLQRSEKLGKVVQACLLYRNHFRSVAIALVLSAMSIMGTNFLYSIQGNTLGMQMDLAHYFFIVPIGLVVSAIPLLPGGIGVGQVAFYKIFLWTGVANPEQGATLCTLLQIYTILFNCLGAFFYLKFKRQPVKTDEPEVGVSMTRATHLV